MSTATRARKPASKPRRDIYAEVTNTLVTALKAGTVPWRKPWKVTGLPLRMNNRTAYRGVNSFMLWITAAERGYASPWWGTYDHIALLSGMEKRTGSNGHQYWASPDGTERGVRKGETGTLVVFWKRTRYTVTDEATGDETARAGMMLRYSYAYNAEQAAQLPARYYPATLDQGALPAMPAAEDVMTGYLARNPGLTYRETGDRAYYQPADDLLVIPPARAFASTDARYGVWFHEAAHSTGHPARLARKGIMEFGHFGDNNYAREELAAQMTSAMLAAVTGTGNDTETERSAAYLASWIRTLRGDSRLAVQAAANAQRAADLIQGITFENDD